MGPAVPVLSRTAQVSPSPDLAGAALLRHHWAHSDCTPGAGRTPEQERHGGTPSLPRCPGAAVTTGDVPACRVCLPAGAPRAEPELREGHPAHREAAGLASRTEGEQPHPPRDAREG